MAILSGFLIAGAVILFNTQKNGNPITIIPAPTSSPIKVYISGDVDKPGVYELPPGSRLEDLLFMAGIDSNMSYQFNLASKLYDGQHILITDKNLTENSSNIEAGNSLQININEANIEELMKLPGIGATRAKDIVFYRETIGYFNKIDDILNVPGIGENTFNQIKDKIVTNSIN